METEIVKPAPLSGFVEWLPEIRAVELAWIDTIRAVFESYGFCSIETPSVEEVRVLAAKGEDVDKEIYGLRRLRAEDGNADDSRVALHYDLTVPMARYVAQNYNDLTFPFKRYQIQRAWRGERPQEGRFREFYQCDIDVVDNEKVSLAFDAELPMIVAEIVERLDLGRTRLHISNRKLLQGFYTGLGLAPEAVTQAIRVVDKLDKIGPDGVARTLRDQNGLEAATIARILDFAAIRAGDLSFIEAVRALGVTSDLLDQGLSELRFVMEPLIEATAGASAAEAVADLSIARGFDYYTGTVYEGKFVDFPAYPTIFAGGRYDNLVGSFLRRPLPGVGISIGLTRIFAKLVKEGRIAPGPKSPAQVLVVHLPGVERRQVLNAARRLRARGINVETYHEPRKLDHQMRYAVRKGIPHVWFPGAEPGAPDEVKALATGAQTRADIDTWRP